MAEEEHVCEFAIGEMLVGLGVADTTVGRPLARRDISKALEETSMQKLMLIDDTRCVQNGAQKDGPSIQAVNDHLQSGWRVIHLACAGNVDYISGFVVLEKEDAAA